MVSISVTGSHNMEPPYCEYWRMLHKIEHNQIFKYMPELVGKKVKSPSARDENELNTKTLSIPADPVAEVKGGKVWGVWLYQ